MTVFNDLYGAWAAIGLAAYNTHNNEYKYDSINNSISTISTLSSLAASSLAPALLSEMRAAALTSEAFSAANFRNYLSNTQGLATAGVYFEGLAVTTGVIAALNNYNSDPSQANEDAFVLAFSKFVFYGALASSLLMFGVPITAVGTTLLWGTVGFELFGRALLSLNIDPLILDLDGDGIELVSLANSNAYLDYGGDGFAERTGWVKGDDGILVFDRNANGSVDGIGEMFGSATQDGFEVLETLDTNNDGKIDASDAEFASLRVWQDANEDAISDTGELKTLAELRRMLCGHPKAHKNAIQSISVNRTDVTGTSQGHDRGFAATFTRALSHRAFSCPPATGAGSTGAAETYYFQTDRADTVDPTCNLGPATLRNNARRNRFQLAQFSLNCERAGGALECF